jgi:hypothetical protein
MKTVNANEVKTAMENAGLNGFYWRHTGGGVGTFTYHFDGVDIYIGPGSYHERTLWLEQDSCCVGAYTTEGDEIGYAYVNSIAEIIDTALTLRDKALLHIAAMVK